MRITSELSGKTLTFETYAPAVLSSEYRLAKLLSVLDFQSATYFGSPAEMHANVYPYLKEAGLGIPDDPTQYQWGKFSHNGAVIVLGIPWIKESTVAIVENTDIVVTIRRRGAEDVTAVRQALIARGFTDLDITVV
ncbi:phage DNA polymerase-associated SH3 family protein [Pseudomonas aeruginosa]|uniref:phage DNA polymerase-associated SH3 family protein n=1 Tax=Pseudomonas aeruginosa TaxID=287 RepID=UPI003D2A2B28